MSISIVGRHKSSSVIEESRDANIVLKDCRIKEDLLNSATLLVDQEHTFYFDHALDHVPGLLLAEGMHQIAEHDVYRRMGDMVAWVSEFEISFNKYCHFSSPITASVTESQDNGDSISMRCCVEQEGNERAVANIVFNSSGKVSQSFEAMHHDVIDLGKASQLDAKFLNKTHVENVFISVLNENMYVISENSRSNIVNRRSSISNHTLYLLECFMQTQRYKNYLQSLVGTKRRVRDILKSIKVSMYEPSAREDQLFVKVISENVLCEGNRYLSNTAQLLNHERVLGKFEIITANVSLKM